jgi:hypothetical protein
MDTIVKVVKQIALFTLIPLGLGLIFPAINKYWDFQIEMLTVVFAFFRRLIGVFDFAFDTTTLFLLLTIVLNILVGYWLFKAYNVIAKFFNDK